jgi:hypothetical protein
MIKYERHEVENSLDLSLSKVNLFDNSMINTYIIDRAYTLTFAANKEDLKILFDERILRTNKLRTNKKL